jgi:heterotetrameric sarcosine oxidase alpha subunit
MNAQPFRLQSGGVVDRSRLLSFTFDGRKMTGHPGDTVASALLANGTQIVGRSFKYHRPRGILSAGPEEPNALVRIGTGPGAEPNTRATVQPLCDGMVVTSQHCFPSLALDLGRICDVVSPLIPAGFYYKTFMWPTRAWRFYEHFVRRAAGLGLPVQGVDPDNYVHRNTHCDVLVVGAGPAGIAAALEAARHGGDVIIVDEHDSPGGALLDDGRSIQGESASKWLKTSIDRLSAENVRMLWRTTAFGIYDDGLVGLLESAASGSENRRGQPRQRRWQVRARRIVLATGSIERPLVFSNNDLPGIMLSAAVRKYANRYAVVPGRRAVVLTNNPDAYRTAVALCEKGIKVEALVDLRPECDEQAAQQLRQFGVEILFNSVVNEARGRPALTSVDVAALDSSGNPSTRSRRIDCDLLCVSGGFTPSIHLHAMAGGKLRYDETREAFVPERDSHATLCAGAARGVFTLRECLEDGAAAGAAAIGIDGGAMAIDADPEATYSIRAIWDISTGRAKRFVDFQNDVTADDLALALEEGYRSIEHVKRYTTLGMGTDQGKTSGMNGLAIVAALSNKPIPQVGITTFRPPYTPVTLGALAGPYVGEHFKPERRSPLDEWHAARGTVWLPAGLWRRPGAYVQDNERYEDAARREALAVRQTGGIFDISTLGKIEASGADAAEFLDRVYCNAIASLPVGKCRYGLMLRDDGIVFDDGTVTRIDEYKYLLTTTTTGARHVFEHLEFLANVAWPELAVYLANVTEQFAQIALAGPASRKVLAAIADEPKIESLPHLATTSACVSQVPVRVARLSFSGELTYEIAVPASHVHHVWERLLEQGDTEGVIPCGIESLGILRIEKGHIAGPEIDGRTTPADLGLEKFVSKKKCFVGKSLLSRPNLADGARPALVGIESIDNQTPIQTGAQLIAQDGPRPVGHVTSATVSPNLGRPIALALVSGGISRLGEELHASSPLLGRSTPVRVVRSRFLDPEDRRIHD